MFQHSEIFFSAFTLGLLGSGHCLAMCGGLSSALGMQNHHKNSKLISSDKPSSEYNIIFYNIGRIFSYTIAGLIVGSLGFWLSQQMSNLNILRYLSALMLILMGLYIGKWFNGILLIERIGSYLWPLIRPLSTRFLPISTKRDAFIVGMVWGWLPCGLVYSALIWASAENNILNSMLIMFCFGLGTLPAMFATGYFSQQLNTFLNHKGFRSGSAILMILFGLWSIPYIQKIIHQII